MIDKQLLKFLKTNFVENKKELNDALDFLTNAYNNTIYSAEKKIETLSEKEFAEQVKFYSEQIEKLKEEREKISCMQNEIAYKSNKNKANKQIERSVEPQLLKLKGKEFKVTSWRELLYKVLQFLAAQDERKCIGFINHIILTQEKSIMERLRTTKNANFEIQCEYVYFFIGEECSQKSVTKIIEKAFEQWGISSKEYDIIVK